MGKPGLKQQGCQQHEAAQHKDQPRWNGKTPDRAHRRVEHGHQAGR
jgi:hypothetical protein